MKRQTRSSTGSGIQPADIEINCEKSDEHSEKKIGKRRKPYVKMMHDYLIEYMSNSNIHGLKYIGEKKRTRKEKIFWILMFTCSVVICAWLILKVYIKWRKGPVIVSFAADSMPVSMIPYPAVTVCFETKAMQSKYNFTKYFHLYNGSETYKNLTDIERSEFEDVSLVCDSHLSPENGRKFSSGKETVDTLKRVCPSIAETFFGCKWKDVNKDYCTDLFWPILTEEGICYTFNTLGAHQLLRENNLHADYQYLQFEKNVTTPWTLESGYPGDAPIETYPHRGAGFGAQAGLIFVLMATEVDLDYLCHGPVQGYKVFLN